MNENLQMANEVTMPTDVPTLNSDEVDGKLFSSYSHVVVMVILFIEIKKQPTTAI